MTLIGETSIGRDGSNSLARPQQLPRPIKPTHKPEGVGRHAVTFCEHTSETLTAQSHSRGCLTYRLEIRRNWLCGIFLFSHAQPMPAYHLGHYSVTRALRQGLDFIIAAAAYSPAGTYALRQTTPKGSAKIYAEHLLECRRLDLQQGRRVAFDRPTSSGKNKCNLVLAVEVRWQPNTAPMDGTKLHKSVFRWAPIIPSSPERHPAGIS
jgi:hypothetical protein